MKISFIGDIMLGRFVREKYEKEPYDLVDRQVMSLFDSSDYVIANLESPITDEEESDSLKFAGKASLLQQLDWIDYFSLSNNHINDFGEKGMEDTMFNLNEHRIGHNGLYKERYIPITITDGVDKIAIITCTDMLNYEFADNYKYKLLRVDHSLLKELITEYKSKNYIVLLFAHVGSLFCRYPNPLIRDILYGLVDCGTDGIITAHSHCLGGVDVYKGVPIFYSLGDFLMDGASFRRRQACVLRLEIINNKISGWSIFPVKTSLDLQVVLPSTKESNKIQSSFDAVSAKIQKHKGNYKRFYSIQYKKEMLLHSLSTLKFLYKTKGISGFISVLITRFREIKKMADRTFFGRSKMRYDSDAVSKTILPKDKIR